MSDFFEHPPPKSEAHTCIRTASVCPAEIKVALRGNTSLVHKMTHDTLSCETGNITVQMKAADQGWPGQLLVSCCRDCCHHRSA